ncbi:MAG TPA: hypothetical protein VHU81_16465, partial [Thermoanaerobaculia bacterium]|nr:hypothetical protein [Thermoanaerobaculia bacterium]
LLLRMEGKTWSLCTGFFNQRLYLSIRTTNQRADAGALMHRLVGRRGKGGGHGRMAGGWVDASKLAGPEDRRRLQKQITSRIAKELKKNPDRLGPVELRLTREAKEVKVEGKDGRDGRPEAKEAKMDKPESKPAEAPTQD